MLRFLSHASITLCCLPLLGCSNDSAYTATAVLSLNQTNDLAPVVTPRSPVERAVQLERYAALITGYRVLNAVINDPDINEVGMLLERMGIQMQLNLPVMRIDIRPYVPGFVPDN